MPNPSRPGVPVRFATGVVAPASIRICDTAGQVVRVLSRNPPGSGFQELVWDGRDDQGRELRPGVYFYLAKMGEEELAGNLVVAP